jgi:DNA-binding MarR family transcriptional regulator
MMTSAKPKAGRKTSKRASQLRFEILNAFVDSGMANLSRAELAVWLILYRDSKRDGIARSAVGDLARRAGIDRRSVLRALKRLRDRRMLRLLRRGGLNRGPSSYRVFPFPMEG